MKFANREFPAQLSAHVNHATANYVVAMTFPNHNMSNHKWLHKDSKDKGLLPTIEYNSVEMATEASSRRWNSYHLFFKIF